MLLKEIYTNKLKEVAQKKAQFPIQGLQKAISGLATARDIELALRAGGGLKLIAEIKGASPSSGILRKNLDPLEIALQYQQNGASAISVLTDERFFHGKLSHLEEIRRVVKLPLLRKDFIIDPYQLYETRVAGADAVLLIAALLDKKELEGLLRLARELGLGCLVEAHTEKELKKVLDTSATLLGINNRNLQTFQIDLETTLRLRPLIPRDKIVVSESGINTRADVLRLKEAGIDAILVGEALMLAEDPGAKIRELMGWT